MIAEKMETRVLLFLYWYGKVEHIYNELDMTKPFIFIDKARICAIFCLLLKSKCRY